MVAGRIALAATLYRLPSEGGLEEAAPLVELLHRPWVAEDDLAEARLTIGQLGSALDDLSRPSEPLRSRRIVRLALRLRGD